MPESPSSPLRATEKVTTRSLAARRGRGGAGHLRALAPARGSGTARRGLPGRPGSASARRPPPGLPPRPAAPCPGPAPSPPPRTRVKGPPGRLRVPFAPALHGLPAAGPAPLYLQRPRPPLPQQKRRRHDRDTRGRAWPGRGRSGVDSTAARALRATARPLGRGHQSQAGTGRGGTAELRAPSSRLPAPRAAPRGHAPVDLPITGGAVRAGAAGSGLARDVAASLPAERGRAFCPPLSRAHGPQTVPCTSPALARRRLCVVDLRPLGTLGPGSLPDRRVASGRARPSRGVATTVPCSSCGRPQAGPGRALGPRRHRFRS